MGKLLEQLKSYFENTPKEITDDIDSKVQYGRTA